MKVVFSIYLRQFFKAISVGLTNASWATLSWFPEDGGFIQGVLTKSLVSC